MNILDDNDEHENSEEDEDSILLAAVVDENEDERKMPALPVVALPVATNKKQKKAEVTNKAAPNTRNRVKVWQSNSNNVWARRVDGLAGWQLKLCLL